MTNDLFTLSIDNEILLISSDSKVVRNKIEELKKEQTPYFTFTNTLENLIFNFTKKDPGNGYWVARDIYLKPTEKITKKVS
jgi:hypothetical protein